MTIVTSFAMANNSNTVGRSWLKRVTLASLLFGFGGGASSQGHDLEHLYHRATELLVNPKGPGITHLLDSLEVLSRSDTAVQTLYRLLQARAARYEGRYADAYRALDAIHFDTAAANPILTYSLHAQKAKVLKGMELHDEARRHARAALATARKLRRRSYGSNMVLLMAEIDLHQGRYADAMEGFHNARSLSGETGQESLTCNALLGSGNVHYHQERDSLALVYYRRAMDCAEAMGSAGNLLNASLNAGAALSYLEGPEAAIALYRSLMSNPTLRTDQSARADILTNMASFHTDLGQFAEALTELDQALDIFARLDDTASLAQVHLFKATAYWGSDQPEAAITAAQHCRELTRSLDLKAQATKKLADYLNHSKRFEEAFVNLLEFANYSDSLSRLRFSDRLASAEVEFETAEKERRITEQDQALELADEQDRRKSLQRNLAIGSALALVGIALLLWRSLRTRRKLAKQEQELHAKRVDELMHEQEIGAINAMLEGQEKERDRLAKDLHDRLGSMLSAIKHQLGAVEEEVHLVRQDQSAQYNKVHSMLDDAVGEVRRISHDMITVTLSRFGLQKALEDLCDTVRVTGRMDVELRTFGLEQRMERSMEIAVYRIVQESISNVLKHAQATELSVDVTRGPGRLSVIVHDDGKGFDPSVPATGIGLENVKSRASAIGATLRVESTIGKGTTVSVEGPVVE